TNCKIIIFVGAQFMPLAQNALDFLDNLEHLLGRFGRQEPASDGPQEFGAHDFPFGGGEWDEDHIVLISSSRIVPLWIEYADDLEWYVLDPDRGAHRIFPRLEQVL